MNTPDLSFLPVTAAGREFVGWDGFSYVDASGYTVWGGGEPSAADLVDALASPRTPPLPVVSTQTRLTLLSRMTDAEKLAIMTSTDAGVVIFRTMFLAANEVRSDDERTLDGFGYLVALGLLDANRPAEILAHE